jgi:hypothetical protein
MEAAVAEEEEALHQQQQQQQAEHASINNLPPAILHGVFSHLGPRDLCCVSCTCLLWRRLTRDKVSNSTWRHFYTQRWSVMPPAGADVCWQSKYGSKMKQVCVLQVSFSYPHMTRPLLYAHTVLEAFCWCCCLWQASEIHLRVQHASVLHPSQTTQQSFQVLLQLARCFEGAGSHASLQLLLHSLGSACNSSIHHCDAIADH